MISKSESPAGPLQKPEGHQGIVAPICCIAASAAPDDTHILVPSPRQVKVDVPELRGQNLCVYNMFGRAGQW
jgi:hypothetical protein